jgi:hypothetical protein
MRSGSLWCRVLHEHRLCGLRSPRLAATEPTIPQGALGAPLTAIFALVLARASYRSTPGAIRRNRFPAQNAERGHGFTSDSAVTPGKGSCPVVKLVFLRAFTGTTSPACRKYFLTQLALMPLASVNCCPSACPHLLTFLVCVTFRPSRLTQPCLNPEIEIGATIANQFFSGPEEAGASAL